MCWTCWRFFLGHQGPPVFNLCDRFWVCLLPTRIFYFCNLLNTFVYYSSFRFSKFFDFIFFQILSILEAADIFYLVFDVRVCQYFYFFWIWINDFSWCFVYFFISLYITVATNQEEGGSIIVQLIYFVSLVNLLF